MKREEMRGKFALISYAAIMIKERTFVLYGCFKYFYWLSEFPFNTDAASVLSTREWNLEATGTAYHWLGWVRPVRNGRSKRYRL